MKRPFKPIISVMHIVAEQEANGRLIQGRLIGNVEDSLIDLYSLSIVQSFVKPHGHSYHYKTYVRTREGYNMTCSAVGEDRVG